MTNFLHSLLGTSDFMPHGHCYLWQPGMVALQTVSNGLIGLSYVAISGTLAYLVYRIRDLPFHWIYLAFGTFIVACGLTHFMDIWTVWEPRYWLDGWLRAVTATASVATAVILPTLVPKAAGIARAAKQAQDRGIELEASYRQLGEVLEKTRELDELKTHFFANVSHELRTPLTLIIAPAERMRAAANLTDAQRRDLEVMARNGRVLLKHVNDLLDVAKLEAGKMKPKYVRSDVALLLRRAAGNFDAVADERKIRLELAVPDSLPADVDPDMFQRVALNLLSNAFKFTPDGGRIRVTAGEASAAGAGGTPALEISVADTGPGVPAGLREAIFERFRQGELGANRSVGGTGLGLSIAQEFVELHGGGIRADESPLGPTGADFRVRIPAAAPPGVPVASAGEGDATLEERRLEAIRESTRALEASAARSSAAEAASDADARTADAELDFPGPVPGAEAVADGAREAPRARILVVEDNPDVRRFVRETLEPFADVATAADGEAGLRAAIAESPDLVVSDLMMPVMSGDRMVALIRERPELADLPILLLTAKADDELKNRLLGSGVQDYVLKPFSPEELLARARNLVAMKRVRSALQLEIDTQIHDLEVLAREVSARKRQLQGTVEELKVAKEEAERASAAKSNFLGLLSHEIRTPLTVLKLQLEMLRRGDADGLSERQRALIDRIEHSSERSIALMDSLLEFTRLQSGRIEPRVEAIDVPALIAEAIESVRGLAETKALEIRARPVPAGYPALRSDRALLGMILRNLLSNAIKYTESGSVEIAAETEKGGHAISVVDSGPGIAAADHEKIFEPFVQLAELEKKHVPGVGLGLTIAKRTAAEIGGTIELRSEAGHGARFVTHIPDLPGDPPAGAPPPGEAP